MSARLMSFVSHVLCQPEVDGWLAFSRSVPLRKKKCACAFVDCVRLKLHPYARGSRVLGVLTDRVQRNVQKCVAVGVVGFVVFLKYRGDLESLQAVRKFGLCVSAWVKVFPVRGSVFDVCALRRRIASFYICKCFRAATRL